MRKSVDWATDVLVVTISWEPFHLKTGCKNWYDLTCLVSVMNKMTISGENNYISKTIGISLVFSMKNLVEFLSKNFLCVSSLISVQRSSIHVAIHLSFSCQLNSEIFSIHPSSTVLKLKRVCCNGLKWFETQLWAPHTLEIRSLNFITIFCHITHKSQLKCAVLKSCKNYFIPIFKYLNVFI